ncbi:MAG: rod shape-determining protein [Parcubacteria group bacterium CG1_02_40_82]|uniref:Cell shape-determining protein MreB n=4 Tax=Candidatus Portnoyibacteriota TaxID=1817913 RepID=A0A2M7IJ43_9BACT|nr:MAG: rod shape-determining protein [Parcubacteria group bacterium CG1_02_40_82]PIQ75060.1 MAG: rod shape-determining protein [Candidatus Portnoybacteria bacterium CG11_big_fil_rev_8_21_14_0_20_40_15]PIW76478.1 MAG: rod shape-determining protein [Candidatus Portnoybacteria bacterium CG_4_8_14_3_um_filter_40_10]PIY75359.1 MAG: rod shape-determining protein [Candidatus Portnoybacteria bacterium CG_4_10_14_0_8_um_filter_40_50]PJA64223.1 MAG: rod shape-determining protein [Candidatus Portnoybacte
MTPFFIKKIGIDLGTANTLVFVPGKGMVINEPTVVAISLDDNRILAVGNEAKEMLGRTPDTIIASRPLRDGVIADYRLTEAMLRYFINKTMGSIKIFRPEVMVAVPAGITSTERRAVVDATLNAGAKAAYIVKEPVLAAIGAGIPINEPAGHMIIDIGGGTSEVAVISLGGIVAWASVRVGGNKLDQAITEFLRKKYNLAVGERTAEEIKIAIGSALPQKIEQTFETRGRDLISGLPKNIIVKSNEITEAIADNLREIIQTIKIVLHDTPPELSADVMDKGMVLSGGGALLKNLDELISQATGVPCYIAEDPLFCVAKGTGIALEHLEVYKRSVMSKK